LEFFLDTLRKHERSSSRLRFPAVEPAAAEAEPLVDVFLMRVILKAENKAKSMLKNRERAEQANPPVIMEAGGEIQEGGGRWFGARRCAIQLLQSDYEVKLDELSNKNELNDSSDTKMKLEIEERTKQLEDNGA
ncbi:hypothetical protein PIB30_090543, partial [Stylosanthes scabra]|nr:hypothetical protein [Stylosanthes scabra]